MTNFFAPADQANDWQQLLAKPYHWKTGYSAKSLAYSWTEASGFPAEVSAVFNSSEVEALQNLEFLLGFPEYEVPLPGGKRASQNDIFVLAKGKDGLVSIAVEGKVSESFDSPVAERFREPTEGQRTRLEYLIDILELQQKDIGHIGYQLLHRCASALIEAHRFEAKHAVMLIHSFSQNLEHFDDYSNFAALYGVEARPNGIHHIGKLSGVDCYLAWAVGNPEYLSR